METIQVIIYDNYGYNFYTFYNSILLKLPICMCHHNNNYLTHPSHTRHCAHMNILKFPQCEHHRRRLFHGNLIVFLFFFFQNSFFVYIYLFCTQNSIRIYFCSPLFVIKLTLLSILKKKKQHYAFLCSRYTCLGGRRVFLSFCLLKPFVKRIFKY